MSAKTAISWCDSTFNCWWGCDEVGEDSACTNCYARIFDKRVGGDHWGAFAPRRFFGEKHWNEPLKWNRNAEKTNVRARVFCGSMCDVMETLPHGHPDRPRMEAERRRVCALVEATPWLDWMFLTKRTGNYMKPDYLPAHWLANGCPPNFWAGTTVERNCYLGRIDQLRHVPARVRFLSCEPLLENLHLRGRLQDIHWVIGGGESGANSRPTEPQWARDLHDAAKDAGAAYHWKQWGTYLPADQYASWEAQNPDCGWEGYTREFDLNERSKRSWRSPVGTRFYPTQFAHKNGFLIDGQTWQEFPA